MRATIIGTGLYAPSRVVPNAHFDALYGQDVDSFLRERRNIRERRWAAEGEATSDLATHAARQALERAGIAPGELDLIVVATDTPDFLSPSTAAVVQHKLDAAPAATFDLNTACAGFVTALDVARRYVETGGARRVLVVGAYLMSRFIDFEQRNTASLFADGAGAVVLGPAADAAAGILASRLESYGAYHGHMGLYTGGAAQPIVPGGDGAPVYQQLEFRAKFPKTFNRDHWSRLAHRLADEIGVGVGDVDHFFFTQINVESIWETMEALELQRERAHTIMDRYGYTGSACVPMALADAEQAGRLAPGDLCFLIASGGGSAMAAAALRWSGAGVPSSFAFGSG